MGVLEDGEIVSDHMESASDGGESVSKLGRVLYRAAATAAAGSGSDTEATSESSGADSGSRKKRKRSE